MFEESAGTLLVCSRFVRIVGSSTLAEGENGEEDEFDTTSLPVHAQLLHGLLRVSSESQKSNNNEKRLYTRLLLIQPFLIEWCVLGEQFVLCTHTLGHYVRWAMSTLCNIMFQCIDNHWDADGLYFLLTSVKYICLHGECFNYIVKDHEDYVKYALRKLMLPK